MTAMTNEKWRLTLQICRRILGLGDWDPYLSESWCAFTTFTSLEHGAYYFNCGFPREEECLETCVQDGGVWRQSFDYDDLAHLIVPKTFYWERVANGFESGSKSQNIGEVSLELVKIDVEHRISNLVLEIKIF